MRYRESDSRSSSGGVGFVGMLQLAFIILKLVGAINWSWFWVLSPTVISLVLFGILLVLMLISS